MPRLLAALFTVLILCLGTTTPASALKPAATVAACNWNAPGHRPFMGDVVAAIDRYQDIPAAVRDTLRRRMAQRSYDEVVRIRRDSILGRQAYGAEIRDMHFADGQVCATVDRSGWTAQAEERGLVYCESGHCILVPTVCRNVSRIRVLPAAAAAATAGTQPPPVAAANLEAGPSAGQSAGSGAGPQAPGGDSAALPLEQVRSALGAAAEPAGGQALPSAATWQDLASRVPADGNQPRPDGDWQTPALSPVSIRVPQGNLAPPLLPLLPLLPPVPPLPLLPQLPQLPQLPPLPAVPEPASLVLMLAGLVALAWVQARRRGRASEPESFSGVPEHRVKGRPI